MLDCTHPHYATLYSRWLKNPGNLLVKVGYDPSKDRLLDLCGGTGAVSLAALEMGADPKNITLVDLNPRCPNKDITQIQLDLRGYEYPVLQVFDVIVIRQAAAYLLWDSDFIRWLSCRLRPGGRLIFNTFVRPKWSWKTYKEKGRRFFEASWYFGRTVWHIQTCPSLRLMDLTCFKWLKESVLCNSLGEIFKVEIEQTDATQYWTCTKKDPYKTSPPVLTCSRVDGRIVCVKGEGQ